MKLTQVIVGLVALGLVAGCQTTGSTASQQTQQAAAKRAFMSGTEITEVLAGQSLQGFSDGHPYTQDWNSDGTTVYHGRGQSGAKKDFPGTWRVNGDVYESNFDWGLSRYRISRTGNCAQRWVKLDTSGAETAEIYDTKTVGCEASG